MHFPYVGSGPYCYSNSFAMMFGAAAPPVTVIEFATGSPFGMQVTGGGMPFFDPFGWTPEAGFDTALALLGWRSQRAGGGDAGAAHARLEAALREGPVWIGPVEMGHLAYQPEMTGPIGADHYVVALAIAEGRVLLHDPQGYPYANLALPDFMTAWRAETIDYGEAYTMRWQFRQERAVDDIAAIRAAIPYGRRWLSKAAAPAMPPGSLGNGEAALALAERLERGLDEALRGHLVYFAVRVGARRAADGAGCLLRVGYADAAAVMDEQARLIGALQRPLVAGDGMAAAAVLRALAPSYDRLLAALDAATAPDPI
ncbi:hypothetical protein [Labrys neptuniae]